MLLFLLSIHVFCNLVSTDHLQRFRAVITTKNEQATDLMSSQSAFHDARSVCVVSEPCKRF